VCVISRVTSQHQHLSVVNHLNRMTDRSTYQILSATHEYILNQLFENRIVEQSVKLIVDIFTVFILFATIILQVVSMIIATNTLVSSFYGLLCQHVTSLLSPILFLITIPRERKATILSGKIYYNYDYLLPYEASFD